MKIFHFVLIFLPVHGKLPGYEKAEFCDALKCDESVDRKVCGIKYKDGDVIFKLFDNECKLLKYGCQVDDSETYGIINMKYCGDKSTVESEHVKFVNYCPDCTNENSDPVCGIRPDGEGFKIRIFGNECRLRRHNCDNEELQFTVTDFFICSHDPNIEEEDDENEIFDDEEVPVTIDENSKKNATKTKNIVVVDGTMLDSRNINGSIRNFFAVTHELDLPIKDIQSKFNIPTRRRLVKNLGPVKVFTPSIEIPKNISDDFYHKPTLNSCYHRCPVKCPEYYAPVCGLPGTVAREPALMFRNHCYMDVAQCKMRWEGKSYTAESSAYIEASFVFCLGYDLAGLYRFLPVLKTLQRMGRIKKRATFKYKMKNMKFFNNFMMSGKIMG